MAKRKYEIAIYSKGYAKVLFKDWVWAASRKQAFKLIRDRLVKNKNMEALYYWGMDDLPRHAVDITNNNEREPNREVEEDKTSPMALRNYDTCPKCGSDTEADYCQGCGWQRFAGVKKASGIKIKNNNDNNNEDEEF